MKRLLAVLAAAFATAAIAVTPALAGTLAWTQGQGTFHECEGGETPGLHWVFTAGGAQGNTVTSATLTVNGSEVIPMSGNANGTQWDADSSGATEPTSASVTYVGNLGQGNANLVISHGCFAGETTTTTTTTTGGPTTSTTTGGPTTSTTSGGPTTSTTSGGPTTSTTSGGPTSTTAGPTGSGGIAGGTTGGTGGTTGGTAATGGNLPFTGLPIWLPLLAAASLLASGIMLIRRRKGEIS
jgi:hypothetical protein